MTWNVLMTLPVIGLCGTEIYGQELRRAVAIKAELIGEKAAVTVAFNYTGQPGDPPTFSGVRMYRYEVPVDKGPTRVGWEGQGRQTVVLRGERYTFYPAVVDRHENGTIAVARTKAGKLRLIGVYHYAEVLFVFDEEVGSGDPILLETMTREK